MYGFSIDPEQEAARDAAFHAPAGWFALALSSELAADAVIPRRAFGRDMVVWRTSDGLAHVADAECPHFGAHMGKGTMKEDGLACPIHGLRFDAGGACLPARPGKLAPALSLRTYPVREEHGVIHLWRDPARGDAAPFTSVGEEHASPALATIEANHLAVGEAIASEPVAGTLFHVTPIEAEISQVVAIGVDEDANLVLARLCDRLKGAV